MKRRRRSWSEMWPGTRLRGAGGNLLRRPVDRAEKLTMAALLVTALIAAVVVSLLAGHKADISALRSERADHGARQVAATLLQSAAQAASTDPWGVAWVPAEWQVPGGHAHTGQVAAELNAQAGQHILVWVNKAGRMVSAPVTEAGVRDQVTFVVLSVLMGMAVITMIAVAAVRHVFDRRRMAGWQRAWEAIGPIWTRQA